MHLEKKKQQLLDEQDELQEQISHSQEIIEKLSDAEEVLKERYETCRFLFAKNKKLLRNFLLFGQKSGQNLRIFQGNMGKK